MDVYFLWMLEYLITKLPLLTKLVTVILIKAKSRSALLHILLLRIRNYLKSFLRHKFLILETCQSGNLWADPSSRGVVSTAVCLSAVVKLQ